MDLYSTERKKTAEIFKIISSSLISCLQLSKITDLFTFYRTRLSLSFVCFRLVRFEGFLSRVPYKGYSGFGGQAVKDDTWIQDRQERREEKEGEERRDVGYDRGMVQKIVLIILKAVALTTRESR